ncbi:MAG TPA: hypothetical protein VMG10_06645 [Gemmataceae bacterium]|nr:hypothetical protein [Gemmataceae bacterium]
MRFLFVTIALLALAASAAAGYEWRSFPDEKNELSLWKDGVQVGNYRISEKMYYPRLASGVWGDPCPPPYPPPDVVTPGKIDSDGIINFGLERSHISAAGKHLLGGKEVSKEELLQALGKSSLPDDSQWLSLTIIGPEAARQKVLSDLQGSPYLSPWKGRIKVKDYPPDHWAVKGAGFVTTGNPTIYCQAPDGTVLHRQDVYRGPEALAEVLRKADPTYNPDRDPDLNRPLANVPLWVWIGGGILLVLLWKGEEK